MSKKKLILTASIICLGLVNASCGKNNSTPVITQKLSYDFFVSTIANNEAKKLYMSSLTEDQGCLEHIKSVTCFSSQELGGFDPNCSSKEITSEIVSKISNLIETLPPIHQKVFCHINRLQIHTKIKSIGYAGSIQDEKWNVIGNMIGVRIDALKEEAKNDLFSWKEQLNFGLSKPNDPDYTISKFGPRISLMIAEDNQSQLFYVLVHEISHLIDLMNEANNQNCNEIEGSGKKGFTCTPKENSFSKISWPVTYSYWEDDIAMPQELQGLYPWLSKLCYYSCTTFISPIAIKDVYKELSQSQFVTAYSASNMWEDFAESSTAFVLKPRGFNYKVIDGDNNTLFDLDQNWEMDNLKNKRKWLEDFYSKNDLKYQIETSSK